MDGNANANLHRALTDEILSSVVGKKTKNEIWDTLTSLYTTKSF